MDIEKRARGRVADGFPIEYRVVSAAEYEVLEPQYRLTPTKERSASPTMAAGAVSADEMVVGLLRDLNRKMDRIIELLDKDTSSQGISPVAAPSRTGRTEQGICVDISGAGLLMVGGRQSSAGEFLDMLVPLPGTAAITVGLLGQVTRDSGTAGPDYETAVTFVAINEEDREQVIAHVFQRQRQILALRRELE